MTDPTNGDHQIVLATPSGLLREFHAMEVLERKAACDDTFAQNAHRIPHFKERMRARRFTARTAVILFASVDDPNGGLIADMMLPGFDWGAIREQSQAPMANGIMNKADMLRILDQFDPEAAEKLRTMICFAVVVIDHGVAEIYPAQS